MFWSLLLASSLAFASISPEIRVPDESKSLVRLETGLSGQQKPLPNHISILVWNIHKASEKEKWATDFLILSKNADLVLLQESVNDPIVLETLQVGHHAEAWMGVSFEYENSPRFTGVMSLSHNTPIEVQNLRSPDREPILKTPKQTLVSYFDLEHSQNLLVLNTHGINFVSNKKWRRQLKALRPLIASHSGPIIWGGDFNTWNGSREKFLMEFTRSLGLTPAPIDPPINGIQLDYIFTRDCAITHSESLTEISSSDHAPLAVSCELPQHSIPANSSTLRQKHIRSSQFESFFQPLTIRIKFQTPYQVDSRKHMAWDSQSLLSMCTFHGAGGIYEFALFSYWCGFDTNCFYLNGRGQECQSRGSRSLC